MTSDARIFLISRILNGKSKTLDALAEELREVFTDYGVRFVSVYSPTLLDSEELNLITSSPAGLASRSLKIDDLRSFSRFQVDENRLAIVIEAINKVPTNDAIRSAIDLRVRDCLSNKQSLIRHLIIDESVRTRDIGSFAHRASLTIKNSILLSDDVTMFFLDGHDQLRLGGTTSVLSGISKKDVYYDASEENNTCRCFKRNDRIIEDQKTHFLREVFDRNILAPPLINRGYWPISLRFGPDRPPAGTTMVGPIGVLRLSNIRRTAGGTTWICTYTRYDLFLISFLSEVLYVLFRHYTTYLESVTDVARLTHGLGSNIDAAIKHASILKQLIFPNDANHDEVEKLYIRLLSSGDVDQTLRRTMEDLEYFLGDVQFQIGKFDKKNYPVEKIMNLHGDVFMPMLRLVPAIAAVNNKHRPLINNFKAEGSMDLPPVTSNADALISVFRNIVENAIKYTYETVAKITFNFSFDRDFVYVRVSDAGIGIAPKDREDIFSEGFRALDARRMNNRGVGIGLSYSLEVMKSLGGSVDYEIPALGSTFCVRIRRI